MKNLVYFCSIIFILFITSCGKDIQDRIYNGDILVSDLNGSIEALQIKDYKIETINGDLKIISYVDYLDFFKSVKRITGDLTIFNVDKIENLNFLENLIEVKGKILITGNQKLQGINSLNRISKVKSLSFSENHPDINLTPIKDIKVTNTLVLTFIKKENLPVFKNIKSLSGDLVLFNLVEVNDIYFLPNLTKVEGEFSIAYIEKLTTLNGLEKLELVNNGLDIKNNPNLINLDGLNSLSKLKGFSNIIENSKLKSIAGLNSLEEINGSLFLRGTQCEELNGLENLKKCKKLIIVNNKKLGNFCALKPLLSDGFTVLDINQNLSNPSRYEILNNCQ